MMNDIRKPCRPDGAICGIRYNSMGCVLRTSLMPKYVAALRAYCGAKNPQMAQ